MLLDVLHQMPHPLARMVTSTLVMDIPKGPLKRICSRAVGRQEEQFDARMGGEPLFDLQGAVNLGVVRYDREAWGRRSRVRWIQRVEQVQEQPCGLAIPHAVGKGTGLDI